MGKTRMIIGMAAASLALAPVNAAAQEAMEISEAEVSMTDTQLSAQEIEQLQQNVALVKAKATEMDKLLDGITDKATADAAAPAMGELIREISLAMNHVNHYPEIYGMGDEPSDEMKPLLAQAEEMFTVLIGAQNKLNTMAKLDPPLYGSEALIKALQPAQAKTPKTAMTAQETQEADARMRELVGYMSEMKGLFQSIKDKETADAAAPRVKELRDAIDSAFLGMQQWMLEDSIPQSHLQIIQSQYDGEISEFWEVVDTFMRKGEETHYYGSEAMEEALK